MSEESTTAAQEEQIEALRALKGKKRKAAVTALLDTDDGWDTLAAMQRDEDKLMRKVVAEVLLETQGEDPPATAYTLVINTINDDESSVRTVGFKCADAFPPSASLVAPLVASLGVKKARDTLMIYGELAAPALLDKFQGDDSKVAKQALGVLASMDDVVRASEEIKSAMFAAVTSDNKTLSKAVVQVLEDLGIKLQLSKEQLLAKVQEGDEMAAGLIKEWGEDALEPFEELVQSDNPKLRKFGLVHIADLVEYLEADDDYEVLIGALDDDKPAVRKAALDFFAALPFAVDEALEALDGLYDEPAAAVVLLKYGKAAIPTYKDLIRSHGPKNRRTFASLLGKLSAEVCEEMAEEILNMAKVEYDYQALIDLLGTLPKLKLPKEDLAAAIDGHMDNYDERICEAACKATKKLGFPTRTSSWADCRLSTSITRHLFRLGAKFTSTKDRPRESELDQRMGDAIYDLNYGITFPHTRTFNTFDSFGEITFYLPNTQDFVAPERRNNENEITCLAFADSQMRIFGLPIDAKEGADPVVYMTDEEGWETSWQYSSLSFFLQHFERPKSL